jgi:O-antigen/teichoic acid export membrane protein
MLKQRFLVQFGTTAVIHIVGIIAGILVARFAGPGVVGVISYGTAYVSVISFLLGLFGSAHTKLVSEGRDHAECMGVFTILQAGSLAVYIVATAVWLIFQKYILHHQFENHEVEIVVILSFIGVVVGQYEQYAQTIYTANLKQAKANIFTFFRTIAYHLGRIVIVLLGYRAVVLSAWNLLLILLVLPFLYKLLREYHIGRYNVKLAKEYFKYSVPILIIVVVNQLTSTVDKLSLAHYTNTTQLGYYSAAYSIGGMFMLIAGPVGSIFFPLFSGLIAKGNWEGVSSNIRKYQDFIVLFIFPAICTLVVAGGPIMLLVLGQRYQPSIKPFIILLFATYIVLWGMPYGNIISGLGKFYVSAIVSIVKLVVFVFSITVFVSPKFLNLGASGVAFNLLVLNLTSNGLYIWTAKKYGKINLGILNSIRHVVIIALTVGGYFAAGFLRAHLHLWWIIYIPAFIFLTYGILILTRLIGKEHWMTLIEAFNIRKTINYASNEMKGKI